MRVWHPTAVWLALAVAGLVIPTHSVGASGPRRIVAGFGYAMRAVDSGQVYAHVQPITIYERGRYRSGVTRLEDFPTRYETAYRMSILSQVKDFWFYHRGRPVGTMRVHRIEAFTGCTAPLSGFGRAYWTTPPDFGAGGEGEISLDAHGQEVVTGSQQEVRRVKARDLQFLATNPRLPTQDFFAYRTLNAEMKKAVEAIARAESKLAEEKKLGGKPFQIIGSPKLLSTQILDLDRDGIPEVVAEFRAPTTRKPANAFDDIAFTLLLVVRLPQSGRPTILLSLPNVSGEQPVDDGPYNFEATMDANGDGVGEVFVSHGMHEGSQRIVFELRSGRLVPAFKDRYQGC